MPLWKTDSVLEEPSVHLNRWTLKLVDKDNKTTIHVVGSTFDEGRVSTPVQSLSRENDTYIAVTRSGRRYVLPVGITGLNNDANYVFSRWLQVAKINSATDITCQVEDLIVKENFERILNV
jgi:hypothetical protein